MFFLLKKDTKSSEKNFNQSLLIWDNYTYYHNYENKHLQNIALVQLGNHFLGEKNWNLTCGC